MILICFGTRPEWLKVKPLIDRLDRKYYKLLFTGQHKDLLKNVEVDYKIYISDLENRLDAVVTSCISQFPNDTDIDSILVQGDTASVFGCTIAAFHRKLKIYYLESGLRTFNLDHPYPEEGYRQMVSRLADVNLAPTELSKRNLMKENVSGEIHVVGNTVLDNLIEYKNKTSYSNKVLVTLHRRENHYIMDKWFEQLNKLAIANPKIEFILPLHPNPNVQKWKHLLTHVKVVEPMTHSELLGVMKDCKLIITDSGGLQEEGSFLNKKVIVCRETTERPEGIYTGHIHICNTPKYLRRLFDELIFDYYINENCPYGDGKSAERIKKNIRING